MRPVSAALDSRIRDGYSQARPGLLEMGKGNVNDLSKVGPGKLLKEHNPKALRGLLAQFGRCCHYCGYKFPARLTVEDFHKLRNPTRDHRTPRRRGGKGDGNSALACRACNEAKADMTESEFVDFLRTTVLPASYVEYLTQKQLAIVEKYGVKPMVRDDA